MMYIRRGIKVDNARQKLVLFAKSVVPRLLRVKRMKSQGAKTKMGKSKSEIDLILSLRGYVGAYVHSMKA